MEKEIRVEQRWKSWMQLILAVTLTGLFLYMMAPFLVAILLGGVSAIICYPVYQRLAMKTRRWFSSGVVTTAVGLGILLPLLFVLYSGATRLADLLKKLKPAEGGSMKDLANHPAVEKLLSTITRYVPASEEWLREQGISLLQSSSGSLSKIVAAFLAGMPALMLAFSVVILSLYFFLVDGPKFLKFLARLSPMDPERSAEIYRTFEKSCRGVVLGMLISGVVQGILMGIFWLICGLPSPILIFVITTVLGMVPVVGTMPVWGAGFAYLLFNGDTGLALLMLGGGVVVSTSDNVVRPWVMKGQSEMHPLLALVSVFGAVNFLGATGLFIGPIIAAVFVSFLKILSSEIRRENIEEGQGPVTAKVKTAPLPPT